MIKSTEFQCFFCIFRLHEGSATTLFLGTITFAQNTIKNG